MRIRGQVSGGPGIRGSMTVPTIVRGESGDQPVVPVLMTKLVEVVTLDGMDADAFGVAHARRLNIGVYSADELRAWAHRGPPPTVQLPQFRVIKHS